MSGTREYCNGQAHITRTKPKDSPDKTCLLAFLILLFVLICAAFAAFLYHLHLRLNDEIDSFNQKVNHEVAAYGRQFNDEINMLSTKVKMLSDDLEQLKSKYENPQTQAKSQLQVSPGNKYKGIAVENVDEFPDIAGMDNEKDLIHMSDEEYSDSSDEEDEMEVEASEETRQENNHNPAMPPETSDLVDMLNRNSPDKKPGSNQPKLMDIKNSSSSFGKKKHTGLDVMTDKRNVTLKNGHEFLSNTPPSYLMSSTSEISPQSTETYPNLKTHSFSKSLLEDTEEKLESLNRAARSAKIQHFPSITEKFDFNISSENDNLTHFIAVRNRSNKVNLADKNVFTSETVYAKRQNRTESEPVDHKAISRNPWFMLSNSKEDDYVDSYPIQENIKTDRRIYQNLGSVKRTAPRGVKHIASPKPESQVQSETNLVVAAHFGADSSSYRNMSHPSYKGNHHVLHPTGEYKEWLASPWFKEYESDKHFLLSDGILILKTGGLYFVYAQVFFSDNSDVNGYIVYRNAESILQCITTTYSETKIPQKSNTCYTSGIMRFNAGDKLSIKSPESNRIVVLEKTKTFFGAFKLGEL